MNDDELPINDELASAYLDDELDPTERAAASADAHVMATVESFARVRSVLSGVAPVEGSAKDDALAAALAEFDALHIAATAAAPVATVTSLQSRRRAYRALTGVAAAVAILAIGVAAISGTRGGDNKSSSEVAPAATFAPAAADAPSLKVSADTGAAAGTAAPPAAESVAAATASGNASVGATTAAPPPVDTTDALIQYAARIEGVAAPSPQTPTTTLPADRSFGSTPVACLTSHQVVLGGPITVNGTLAYAVRDQGNGTLQAIDATGCTVLLDVPGP
jgi:negative regulator of sigma E activity